MDDQSTYGDPDRSQRIGAAVMQCLRDSSYLDVRNISCEYRRGVVLLQGRLTTFHGKQVAQEAVARIEGVDQVRNEIKVG